MRVIGGLFSWLVLIACMPIAGVIFHAAWRLFCWGWNA